MPPYGLPQKRQASPMIRGESDPHLPERDESIPNFPTHFRVIEALSARKSCEIAEIIGLA
jgi:hypothetical protein